MTTKEYKSSVFWIEWTGTETTPVMVKIIHDENELIQRSNNLPKDNWIEEFDLFVKLDKNN